MQNWRKKAAYFFGILLPLTEIIRGGRELGNWANYLGEYFIALKAVLYACSMFFLLQSVQHISKKTGATQ